MNNIKLETYEFTIEEKYQFFLNLNLFIDKNKLGDKIPLLKKRKGMILLDFGDECWVAAGPQLWRKRFSLYTAMRAGVNCYLVPREEFDKLNGGNNILGKGNIFQRFAVGAMAKAAIIPLFIIATIPLLEFVTKNQKDIESKSEILVALFSGVFGVFLTGMLLIILNSIIKERKIKKIAIDKKRFTFGASNVVLSFFKYLILGLFILWFFIPIAKAEPGFFIMFGGMLGGLLLLIYSNPLPIPSTTDIPKDNVVYYMCPYDRNLYYKVKLIDADLVESFYYDIEEKDNGEYKTFEECREEYEAALQKGNGEIKRTLFHKLMLC